MADETKTEEKPAEGSAEAKPAKSGGMMGTIVSSLIMAAVLGGVGFALAYFVLPSRMQALAASAPAAIAASTNAPAATAPAADANASANATPVTDEKTQRSAADVAASGGKTVTKFTIEEITVNIADTRGNRFVRAGVFFDAAQPVLEELEANRPRIVDTVGQVLSTKTLDQLTSATVRGDLRTQLLGIINPTLKQGRIDNIYFTDLLIQ